MVGLQGWGVTPKLTEPFDHVVVSGRMVALIGKDTDSFIERFGRNLVMLRERIVAPHADHKTFAVDDLDFKIILQNRKRDNGGIQIVLTDTAGQAHRYRRSPA